MSYCHVKSGLPFIIGAWCFFIDYLLDDVICEGHEASLFECESRPWGNHDCTENEAAGVHCTSGPVSTLPEREEKLYPPTENEPIEVEDYKWTEDQNMNNIIKETFREDNFGSYNKVRAGWNSASLNQFLFRAKSFN